MCKLEFDLQSVWSVLLHFRCAQHTERSDDPQYSFNKSCCEAAGIHSDSMSDTSCTLDN